MPAPRVALVTGANSGIGLASAVALLGRGFVVYAGARRPETHADLQARGLRPVALDVTNEASMTAAVQRVHAEAGGVDVLANSAGYGLMGPMEELSLDAVRDQFAVNVFGLLRMSQLVLPDMRRRRQGRIVHVGSVGGLFSAPGSGAYHMSKYALEAMADSMRAEVGGFGVHVALIEPTGVRTPFVDKQIATMSAPAPDGAYETFKTTGARLARALFEPGSRAAVAPEDVARAVVHAATARRPRTRYPVGAVAHVLPRVRRLLTDRAWDRLMLSQVGVTPGAEAQGGPPARARG